MPAIGTVNACCPSPAYRGGYRIKVDMNDGGIVIVVIVIRIFPVVRRQMHMLVWRHQERQQQRERHRQQGKAADHPGDYASTL